MSKYIFCNLSSVFIVFWHLCIYVCIFLYFIHVLSWLLCVQCYVPKCGVIYNAVCIACVRQDRTWHALIKHVHIYIWILVCVVPQTQLLLRNLKFTRLRFFRTAMGTIGGANVTRFLLRSVSVDRLNWYHIVRYISQRGVPSARTCERACVTPGSFPSRSETRPTGIRDILSLPALRQYKGVVCLYPMGLSDCRTSPYIHRWKYTRPATHKTCVTSRGWQSG